MRAGIVAVGALLVGCAAAGGRMRPDPGTIFAEDMTIANALRPSGIEHADWAKGPRIGQGDRWPEGWTCGTMWGQIYVASGSVPPANVRVQIRDCAYWILSRSAGRWRRVQHAVMPAGAAYREDFANDANIPADVRREPDGSISVRLVAGYNYHFWPSSPARVEVDPSDVAGQAAVFFARLVLDDPAGPDERSRARLIGSCGGDHWRALDSRWSADWSNNGDWAIGRFKLLTSEWQVFTACTLPPDEIRRKPPLLEFPAE